MNKQQEPRLRFQGFTGAWEEKKLGDMADIVRGASPRPIQDPKWFDDSSDIGWLRISDVTTQNGRIHYLEQKISKAGQEKTRVIETPHLLLSIAASVGKPVINYVKTGVHDGFLVFKNPNFELEFMFQYLDSFVDTWQSYGQPGTQVNLNSNIVKDTEFLVPTLPEQTHLGLLFRRLDNQIAESRAVLEKSRQLKKAMLAKMFPANGEKIPKIRFKGFEGEWGCRKLGDIANFLKGKGLSKSSIDNDGKTPCILYGELYTKYGCYIGKVVSSTSESIENPILTKSNDILLPTSDVTPNGLAKACSIYFDNIVLGGDILVIRSAEMLGLFFSYYVESNPLMIIEKATGTTVFHIYEKDLRDIVLLLPSYEEQTAIGNFFRQLDETIALQAAEVEKLNQLKKGLLAAMLV
jgi:restriction modification system DNA specificity domain protein